MQRLEAEKEGLSVAAITEGSQRHTALLHRGLLYRGKVTT